MGRDCSRPQNTQKQPSNAVRRPRLDPNSNEPMIKKDISLEIRELGEWSKNQMVLGNCYFCQVCWWLCGFVRKYRHSLSCCTLLYCALRPLHFLQTEGKILHRQRDHGSLYHDTCSTAVVRNQTRSISECVCIHMSQRCRMKYLESK